MRELIEKCAEVTKSKGFDVSQHQTQLLLIASEVAEAIHNTEFGKDAPDPAWEPVMREFIYAMYELEDIRKYSEIKEQSKVFNLPNLLEELSDIVIRVFSYVGGNGWTDKFLQSLTDKIEENSKRPFKHGKGF